MYVCQFCSRELGRPSSLALHEKSCSANPNRVPGTNQFTGGNGIVSEETRRKISEANKRRPPPSAETKAKISRSRIQYLRDHPDKVPYVLNHYSKGESYPEQYWRNVLTNAGVSFEQEKRLSIYRLDFAIGFTNLEIDGEQHYVDPRIVESNRRRDAELTARGWKVIRIRWSTYQKLSSVERRHYVQEILDKIK